jgi:hypothetical protein
MQFREQNCSPLNVDLKMSALHKLGETYTSGVPVVIPVLWEFML